MIEDDPGITASAAEGVWQAEGYHVAVAMRGDDGLARAAREALRRGHHRSEVAGLEWSGTGRANCTPPSRALPIILMTAFGTTETAIEATKLGAYDYLLKPFDMLRTVRSGSPKPRTAAGSCPSRSSWAKPDAARDALVGRSRAMQAIYKEIGRVAAKPSPC